MNWLTLLSLRWGTYSAGGFLTFIAVLNPLARYGVLILILCFLGFLGIRIYQEYLEALTESSNYERARSRAIAENAPDLLMLVAGIVIGLFLGFF